MGQDIVHPGGSRLPGGRRPHRGALWRYAAGLARHAGADVQRADFRVQGAGGRLRHLQLHRTRALAYHRSRGRAAGGLQGHPAQPGGCWRVLQPGFQGRRQMGQPQRPRVRRIHCAQQPAAARPALRVLDARGRTLITAGGAGGGSARRTAHRGTARRPSRGAKHAVPHRGGRRWSAPALLGRPAWAVRGNDRHQLRRRTDPVRARPGLPGRDEPPGQ
ncbi:hypothetical protein D9M68_721970 [compost metagenome]